MTDLTVLLLGHFLFNERLALVGVGIEVDLSRGLVVGLVVEVTLIDYTYSHVLFELHLVFLSLFFLFPLSLLLLLLQLLHLSQGFSLQRELLSHLHHRLTHLRVH